MPVDMAVIHVLSVPLMLPWPEQLDDDVNLSSSKAEQLPKLAKTTVLTDRGKKHCLC